MASSKVVMWIMLLAGALAVGEGLHQMMSTAFWSAHPTTARLNAALYIPGGISCLAASWMWSDRADQD